MLIENGDGTFQAALNSPAGGGTMSIASGDFDGDGNVDLAIISGGRSGLMLGNGDGTFQPPRYLAAGGSPAFVAAADFNGDGQHDLVIANELGDGVSVIGKLVCSP